MSYRIRYYSNSEYEYRRITMASFSYSFVAVDDQSFRIVMEHVGLGREDETTVMSIFMLPFRWGMTIK